MLGYFVLLFLSFLQKKNMKGNFVLLLPITGIEKNKSAIYVLI